MKAYDDNRQFGIYGPQHYQELGEDWYQLMLGDLDNANESITVYNYNHNMEEAANSQRASMINYARARLIMGIRESDYDWEIMK